MLALADLVLPRMCAGEEEWEEEMDAEDEGGGEERDQEERASPSEAVAKRPAVASPRRISLKRRTPKKVVRPVSHGCRTWASRIIPTSACALAQEQATREAARTW